MSTNRPVHRQFWRQAASTAACPSPSGTSDRGSTPGFKPGSQFRFKPGFTIIELLVVVSIIALLIGILLPAISKARDSAKVTQSLANLRNLAAAHQSYAAEWNDRQFTVLRDDLGQYATMADYEEANGPHPPILLGEGYSASGQYQIIFINPDGPWMWPLNGIDRGGWFRVYNVRNFNTYVGGRWYDKTFFAPKDRIPIETVGEFFDAPGELGGYPDIYLSSYCLSPAALFAPDVFAAKDCKLVVMHYDGMGGGAFRVPSMSQARFPSLKTHMLEHHWLQSNRGLGCNPAFGDSGQYDECEPYYFHHAMDSSPAAMFFDGSVRVLGVRECVYADQMLRDTASGDTAAWAGLYFRPGDQEFDECGHLVTDGYFLGASYDTLTAEDGYAPGFHILTKDGIQGRDTFGGN